MTPPPGPHVGRVPGSRPGAGHAALAGQLGRGTGYQNPIRRLGTWARTMLAPAGQRRRAPAPRPG